MNARSLSPYACDGCGQYMTRPERRSGETCITCRGVTA